MKQLSFLVRKSNMARFVSARHSRWGLALLALMCVGRGIGMAHPGHGLADEGALHLVASPYHLSILTATGLALFVLGRALRHSMARRALQFGGVATLVCAAILWGTRV